MPRLLHLVRRQTYNFIHCGMYNTLCVLARNNYFKVQVQSPSQISLPLNIQKLCEQPKLRMNSCGLVLTFYCTGGVAVCGEA
jgi:hypothetical protein